MVTRKLRWATLALLFILSGCSFQEPVLPKWNVPVSIPLSEKTFNMGKELVNDSTIVARGADSLIFISFDGQVDPTRVDPSQFSVAPLDSQFSFTLDTLKLDALQTLRSSTVNLRSLFPQLQNYVGQTVTIPETTLAAPPVILQSTDYRWIQLIAGTLRLKLINNLPFTMGPNAASPAGVTLTVLNDSLNQSVAQAAIGSDIPNGGSGIGIDNFTPATPRVYYRLRIEFSVPVSQPTTVRVTNALLDNSRVTVEASLQNIRASEALAKFTHEQLQRTFVKSIPSSNRLKRGVLDRGQVNLRFFNQLPVSVQLTCRFPDVTTAAGQVLTDNVNIAANGSSNQNIVLNGATVQDAQSNQNFVDNLAVDVVATVSSNNQFVHLKNSDSFSFAVHTDSMFFNYFEGLIANNEVDITPIFKDNVVDYGEVSSGLHWNDANLTLNLFSEISIDNLFADIFVTGYHKNGAGQVTDSARITLMNQFINSGNSNQPGNTVINLNGQQVADFLNVLPTSVELKGHIRMSGNAAIHKDSKVWGAYTFSTPLKVQIRNASPIKSDITTLKRQDVDSDFRKAADEDISGARIKLKVLNHTPFGGQLRLIVSADSSHGDIYDDSYFNPALEFTKSVDMEPSAIDPATGFAADTRQSDLEIALSREEVRLFKHIGLRIGYELLLADTDGTVALRSTDFVKVSGAAEVSVLVHNN